MMKKRHEQKLVLISIILFLLFNIPLMFIFNQDIIVFGVPLLYLALFTIWLLAILVSYLVLTKYYE